MKLVAEYMRDVILFEQMASRETDPERKEALEKQAKIGRQASQGTWPRFATVTLRI
ncbi:MAG: hypothetical protein WAN68_01420 [Pseudolabrys sp.]